MSGPSPARRKVALSLGAAATAYPNLPPLDFEVAGLAPRDAGLARAIWRTTLRRWITIDYLLNRCLRRPVASLEPRLRGVLLAGAAALVFLDRQPAHAVVNDSVWLAREIIRPAAGGLVNAVLRRVSQLVLDHRGEMVWKPHPAHLPMEGGVCRLTEPVLPDPRSDWLTHISVATSHPVSLVKKWRRLFGAATTESVCLHGLKSPPVIIVVEAGQRRAEELSIRPHERAGCGLWEGPSGSLAAFIAAHQNVRVQDPTSAFPLASADPSLATVVLDYCAGLGTKTHQAAWRFPRAKIVAHEVDAGRRTLLAARFRNHARVVVTATEAEIARHVPRGADLVLLDVPCTNTGVLARRPEARYRYSRRSLGSLIALQQKIARSAVPMLRPGGHVLYTTCSLDPMENEMQAQWLATTFGLKMGHAETTMPGGLGAAYQDGGYHAWLQVAKAQGARG